jgi:hypothetical protein
MLNNGSSAFSKQPVAKSPKPAAGRVENQIYEHHWNHLWCLVPSESLADIARRCSKVIIFMPCRRLSTGGRAKPNVRSQSFKPLTMGESDSAKHRAVGRDLKIQGHP